MLGRGSSLMIVRNKNNCLVVPPKKNYHYRSTRFRCMLDQISVNVIARAGSGSGSLLHGAVASAITQVAVTAFAIASGACLSTKVDFLWPKLTQQPGSLILDGVDVTGYPVFNDPKVGAQGNCICKKSSSWPAT